jgi:hypothetical protein
VNAKKHLEEAIKDHDAYLAKNLELEKDRDLWKGRCNQMVGGILPVLDLIDPELPATDIRAPLRGVIDKCQRALGWLHQFVKEVGEYAGAHVLSIPSGIFYFKINVYFADNFPPNITFKIILTFMRCHFASVIFDFKINVHVSYKYSMLVCTNLGGGYSTSWMP